MATGVNSPPPGPEETAVTNSIRLKNATHASETKIDTNTPPVYVGEQRSWRVMQSNLRFLDSEKSGM